MPRIPEREDHASVGRIAGVISYDPIDEYNHGTDLAGIAQW